MTAVVNEQTAGVDNALPESLPPYLNQYEVRRAGLRSRRITTAGKRIYAFTDHSVLTQSGETAGYTLSTVDGFDGVPYHARSRTRQRNMVKLVVSGQAGASNAIISSPANLNVLAGSRIFGLWLYFAPDSTYGGSVNVLVSDQNSFPGTTDYDFGFNTNQVRPGWNFLVLHTSATTHPFGIAKNSGSADFTSSQVKMIGLYLRVPAGQTATFYFDSLWTGFSNKPAVVLGFDDTGSSHIVDYWMPLLREYGLKGYCAYSNNGTAGNNLVDDYDNDASGLTGAIARMTRWHDEGGHDVINHTLNHTNTSSGGVQVLTAGQLEMAVQGQFDLQRRHGWWRGSDIYASSQGQWSVSANAQIAAMGFRAQRNGAQHPNVTLTPFGIDQPDNIGWISLDSPVSGSAIFSNWQTLIDANVTYQSDTWLGAHQIVPGGTTDGNTATGNSLQIYDTSARRLFAYLRQLQDAGTIEVMAPSDWVADIVP